MVAYGGPVGWQGDLYREAYVVQIGKNGIGGAGCGWEGIHADTAVMESKMEKVAKFNLR